MAPRQHRPTANRPPAGDTRTALAHSLLVSKSTSTRLCAGKVFKLAARFLHLLFSLLRVARRRQQGTEGFDWITDKDSSSVLFSTEGTIYQDMFALASDARNQDECPDDGEISVSWCSRNIQALKRDIESLHLEAMMVKRELISFDGSQKEIVEMIDDLKKFFFS